MPSRSATRGCTPCGRRACARRRRPGVRSFELPWMAIDAPKPAACGRSTSEPRDKLAGGPELLWRFAGVCIQCGNRIPLCAWSRQPAAAACGRVAMRVACLYLFRPCHLCGRRLLLLIEPVEDAARLDHAGVGVDVGLRRIGNELQVALLRFEHRDILEERGPDLLDQHLGRLRIADVEVVRLAP